MFILKFKKNVLLDPSTAADGICISFPVGQGGEWEIKNSLSCGSGQIKTQYVLFSHLLNSFG